MGTWLRVIEAPCASHWEPDFGWYQLAESQLSAPWGLVYAPSKELNIPTPRPCTSWAWPSLCATITCHRGEDQFCSMLKPRTLCSSHSPCTPCKRLLTKSETSRSCLIYCRVSYVTDTGTSLPHLFSVTMKRSLKHVIIVIITLVFGTSSFSSPRK